MKVVKQSLSKKDDSILASVEKGSLASRWRKAHIHDVLLPSGLTIKLRSITKKTIRKIMPFLDREQKEGEEKIGDTERSLILQEIITPLHVIEPIVVMSEEEENKDPEKYIYIENIPLMDRFAITGFVLGMSPDITNQLVDLAKQKQLDSFQ